MRAKAEIVEGKTSSEIHVTELPYQVSVSSVASKVAELVDSRQIEGIRDIKNLSSGEDTKLVIYLKRDANASVVLNNLFKHTPLQTNFGVNMVALCDGVPRTLNLAQALSYYIEHQVEVITRRSEFRLRKARDRAHIVEGLHQGPRHDRRRSSPSSGARTTATPPATASWPPRSSSARSRPTTSWT